MRTFLETDKVICGRREMALLILLALTWLCQMASAKVTGGKEIPLHSGQNATIVCDKALHAMNERCQDFQMYINFTAERVPQSAIVHQENGTLYFYQLNNLQPQTTSYQCACGGELYAETTIYVDGELPEIEELNFTSYDFDYISCVFVQPFMATRLKYVLSYISEPNQQRKSVTCHNVIKNRSHIITNCTIIGDGYVETKEWLYLQLTGTTESNLSRTQSIVYENLNNMRPSRPGPVNSSETVVTKDSITMSWSMPKHSHYARKGLIWNITVTPQDFAVPLPSSAHVSPQVNGTHITLKLNNLPYPDYKYKLLMRIRLDSHSGKWSDTYAYDFRTAAAVPTQAPPLTNGSFYLDTAGTSLRLYWASLQPYEFNGPGINYFISEYRENGNSKNSTHIKLEQYSATLEPWQPSTRYEFDVRARNDLGNGNQASRLTIASITPSVYEAHKPQHVRGVYAPNNTTLSWEAPQREPLDYTVFWCHSTREQKHKCTSPISFEQLPSTARYFTKITTQQQLLRMSVSANYEHISTGMHWPICTRDVDDVFAPPAPSVIETSNTTLTVQLGDECAVIFNEYKLTYCSGEPSASSCASVIINKFADKYRITDLEPYTDYTLQLCIRSDMAWKCSDTNTISRTAEGVPSSPNLGRCTERSNTSVILNWERPKAPRGKIQNYIITINDNKRIYEVKHAVDGAKDDEALIAYKLTGLLPHTQYKIFVQAQTEYKSPPSEPIPCLTLMGYPSKPSLSVSSDFEQTVLEWTEPKMPAGGLEYYEVAIRQLNANGALLRQRISYIDGKTCHFETPICEPSNRFEYAVRAVNAELIDTSQQKHDELRFQGDHERHLDKLTCRSTEMNLESSKQLRNYINARLYRQYKSEWVVDKITCSSNDNYLVYFVLFSFFIVCCSVLTVHIVRRKYNKMSNIHVMLPAGLESFCTNPVAADKATTPPPSYQNATQAPQQELIVVPFSEYVHMRPVRKTSTKLPPIAEHKKDAVETQIDASNYMKPEQCASSSDNTNKVPAVDAAPTGGYVTVQNLQMPSLESQKATNAIEPNNLTSAMLGYVQAADLQKLSTNMIVQPIESKPAGSASGYTTMENVIANATKPNNLPKQQETKNDVELIAKPMSSSGYVTQHDLNLMAKNHRNQKQQQQQQEQQHEML